MEPNKSYSHQIHLSPWRIQQVDRGNIALVICCSENQVRQFHFHPYFFSPNLFLFKPWRHGSSRSLQYFDHVFAVQDVQLTVYLVCVTSETNREMTPVRTNTGTLAFTLISYTPNGPWNCLTGELWELESKALFPIHIEKYLIIKHVWTQMNRGHTISQWGNYY